MNLIQLNHIFHWVNTGSRRTFILKDINLVIKEGEFISIMGPSGSGKSTLLHILGTLEEASEGEYFFENEAIHKIKEKVTIQVVIER